MDPKLSHPIKGQGKGEGGIRKDFFLSPTSITSLFHCITSFPYFVLSQNTPCRNSNEDCKHSNDLSNRMTVSGLDLVANVVEVPTTNQFARNGHTWTCK